jgi:hypothetical protein
MAQKNLKRRRARVKTSSAKRKSPSRSSAAEPPGEIQPRIPAAIELVIDNQRESICTAISLLYCLHSALRREIEDGGKIESEEVSDAADGADLTDISAMLLVRLNAVHSGLDSLALRQANVDPERVVLIEKVRELEIGDDEQEAS